MDPVDSITTESNVFNRQPSIYDDSTTNTNNSELLIAVWLTETSTTASTNFSLIESKIENSADSVKRFHDLPKECEEHIRTRPKNVKIFFILPSKYARDLLDNTHDLQVLHSIYVYGDINDKEKIIAYPKVINVYTDLNILVDELSSIVYNYNRHAQLPITIFKQRYEQDQTANLLNKFAYFVDFWNPLFTDLLLDLPGTDYEQQKAKFIEQCRICYRADDITLKDINEFEKIYKTELSIQWYKRDSFVYRLLNKAMRQQNIQGILLLRFFILDLFKQLNQIYQEYIESNLYEDGTYINVYRGQLMFNTEFDNLKQNFTKGTIISVNSFFSTSRTQLVALEYSGAISDNPSTKTIPSDMKTVLFEIKMKIDHQMQLKRKPFADVCLVLDKGKQNKKDEYEILFMAGSFFQIDDIIENEEIEIPVDEIEISDGKIEISDDELVIKTTVTLVKLTLVNEDDLNIPIINDYQILKSTKTIEGKVIRIGNLLVDHSLSIRSGRSKGDRYYVALANELQLRLTAACLTGQAWMALKRGKYDLAKKLALEALDIDGESNDELKITALNCLGEVYARLKNHPEALKCYTKAYDLSKPTDEKIANKRYQGPCIPIDKYAMYDNYRNISSINIARIHQKNGDVQLAWNMYKDAVDGEMRDTNVFHCHTCMTIAESGTHEIITPPEEHNRIWKNWKSFLDLGLVDILKYRTSVVTGYLSLSHQYDFPSRQYNNSYSRTMAIDYFRQVERQCEPYASNKDYYLYTLQCYERLARLYQHWDNRSIDYYEKMIKLCLKYQPKDLENMIIGYKGMVKIYQQQLARPEQFEHISILLCTDNNHTEVTSATVPMTPPVTPMTLPVTPLLAPMSGTLFQNIKPLHFAFDCYEKWIDPRLKDESDLRKKIIYCQMKLAALLYDQKEEADAQHLLILYDQKEEVDAKHSLNEAKLLCRQFGSEMLDAIRICDENLSFIDQNFDFIIQSYKNRLPPVTNTVNGVCIDENNYCYIAQLYQKKNDAHSALEVLQKPVKFFEQYDYVCSHTIDCYTKLAKHYQTIQNDKDSTVDTYARVIYLVKKHRPEPMITTISIIEEHLIDYFKKINDLETTINIYQTLCDIVRHETTDISVLNNHFERVLKLFIHKPDALSAILNVYDAFLNLILRSIGPLTSQMTMVSIHFRDHSINAYKKFNQLSSAIGIYQKLICLLVKHQNETKKITDEYKIIAAEFKTKHLLDDSVLVYDNLLNFVCQHHSTVGFIESDLINNVFYIWKNEILKQYWIEKKFDSAINLYYKMIHFLEHYRLHINTEYSLDELILNTLQNYDGLTMIYQREKKNFDQTMDIYQEQIGFLIKYDMQTVQKCINTIFSKCQQFATDHKEQAIELYSKLRLFIEKNRLDYFSHLSIAYRELAQLDSTTDKQQSDLLHSTDKTIITRNSLNSSRVADLYQRISDYKQKAKDYLHSYQLTKAITVYRQELLPFLLENHARDDEQIATCYKQIASLYYEENEKNTSQVLEYYQKAIDIYEKQTEEFYTEYTFQLNPNVCRRYADILFKCYNFMTMIYTILNDQITADIYKQKALHIYEKHKDQFYFNANPITNIITIERRPFVELSY